MRSKLINGRILIYLALTKEFEISYNPDNAIAVDINKNNATLAVFVGRKLHEIYRIETSIGKIVSIFRETEEDNKR